MACASVMETRALVPVHTSRDRHNTHIFFFSVLLFKHFSICCRQWPKPTQNRTHADTWLRPDGPLYDVDHYKQRREEVLKDFGITGSRLGMLVNNKWEICARFDAPATSVWNFITPETIGPL